MRWRLRKAIADHDAMEADAARNGSAAFGPAPSWPWGEPDPCGCQWWARPATPGADPEPVWRPCDGHADELWRLVHEEDEMCAHCPDCGEELQDEAFEFWCPRCETSVSCARVASEGA